MIGDILQPTHLVFVLVVALLVLGPKRLPEVGRSLGKGIRDFRDAMSGIEQQVTGGEDSPWAPTPTVAAPITPATTTEPSPAPAAVEVDEATPTMAGFAAQVPAEKASAAETLASVAADRPAVSVSQAPLVPHVAHEPDPDEYAD